MSYYAFDLFQGAVFLSAWFGGFGPGLLTTILSIPIVNYFLMPPFNSFSISHFELVRLGVFLIVGLAVSSLSARWREAQLELQKERDDLERRLKERTQEVLTISGREQERMGQDLHDGLCQTLAGTRLLTEALQAKIKTGEEAAEIAKIESRLEQAQAQAAAVSHGLYPVELESEGLIAALEDLAARVSGIYPIDCRFVCRSSPEIQDRALAVHLYRIAQEAVINAVKSGKSRHITARLTAFGKQYILTVADDGVGFSPNAKLKGMGLKIMEYRARMIGATLKFRPRRKRGMLMACAFPNPIHD